MKTYEFIFSVGNCIIWRGLTLPYIDDMYKEIRNQDINDYQWWVYTQAVVDGFGTIVLKK